MYHHGTASLARRAGACLCAAAAVAFMVGAAAAQDGREEHPREAPPTDSATTPAGGLFGAFERFVARSLAGIGASLSRARGEMGEIGAQAGGAARDTATAVARIPRTTIVTGRQICERAANGSPDCRSATVALCRRGGFDSGQSLDVQSAEKCPARVYIAGRPPAPGECTLETYVTRALCQ